MLISRTRILTAWRAMERSASSALPASENVAPSRESARISRSPRRTTAWSSVIRMCIVGTGLGPALQRHAKSDGGPVAGRTGDIQGAAADLRPFFHAEEAKGSGDFRFAEAFAVVGNDEDEIVPHFAQGDAGRLCFGVAHDVGEAFLEDAEEFCGLFPFQGEIGCGDRDYAVDAGTGGEFIALPFDGGSEAEVIEHAGTQSAADFAYGTDAVIDQPDGAVKAFAEFVAALGQMAAHPCQVELDGGEDLADLVVQIAREAGAFLFTGTPQAFSQSLELFALEGDLLALAQRFFGALAIGDIAGSDDG